MPLLAALDCSIKKLPRSDPQSGSGWSGVGLVTGLLVGIHFQELEEEQTELDRQIEECERELQRVCDEWEKLRQAEEED